MHLLLQIGLFALGSAIGGLARWGVAVAVGQFMGTAFPYGTLLINVSGSLFLGWFLTVLEARVLDGVSWLRADDLKLMIAVGFTGAYTTFSTFEYETHSLFRDDDRLLGLAYIGLSLFLGLLAVHLGVLLAKWQYGGTP